MSDAPTPIRFDPQNVMKARSVDRPQEFIIGDDLLQEPRADIRTTFFADAEKYNKTYTARLASAACQGLFLGWFYTTAKLSWYPSGILVKHKGVEVPHVERLYNWGWTMNQYMRPMTICGGISFAYVAVECAMENIQGYEKPWLNQGAGGVVAGFMTGLLRGRFDIACVTGAVLGILFTGLGYGQYRELNEPIWKKEGTYPVSHVTEETFKEQYPEYKDI